MPQTIHLFLEALANPEDDARVQRVLALRDGGWQRRDSDDGEETALLHDDGIILFLDRETRVLVHVLLTAHGLVALHEAGDDLVDELVPTRDSLHELLGAPQAPGEGASPRDMWLLGQRRWLFAEYLESGIVDELTLRCIPHESPRDTRWSQPGAPTGRIDAYRAAFGQPEASDAVQHALRLHGWDWTLDGTGATSLPLASLSHAIFSDVASVGVESGPTDDRAVVAVTFDHAAFRTTDAIAQPVLDGPHDLHGATMAGVRVALGQPLGLLAGAPGTDRASHDLFALDDGLALVVTYDDMRVVTRAVLQPVPPQLR